MAQYIDKDALVAELEKRTDELYDLLPDAGKVEKGMITISEACNTGKYTALESFRKYIDTLEVKEVDIEKEVIDWWNAHYSSKAYTFEGYTGHYVENSTLIKIAKHFFELGMNVKLKGIDTTRNIDAILEEKKNQQKHLIEESREVKTFKEAFYNAIDTYLPKAQKEKQYVMYI